MLPVVRTTLTAAAVLLGAACTGPSPDTRNPQDGTTPRSAAQNRPDVAGTTGAVTAGHPLAAQAGYRVLRRGGNAVDAAVTMAAVLAVVRPHMNGLGGDAFALIRRAGDGEVVALNASGRAGEMATPGFFRERGMEEIPERGGASVTVPGAVAGWADALARFGTISLERALAPAIRLASRGFPVSQRLHDDLASFGDVLNAAGRETYLPDGTPPRPGSLLRSPALAGTLRAIATGGADAFYRGEIAAELSEFLAREGGYLRSGDFADHTSTWTEPVEIRYVGHRVLSFPPNSQGLVLLQQMGMARHFELDDAGPLDPDYLHTLVELKKVAFADRDQWISDPALTEIPVDSLLDPGYLEARAGLVSPDSAAMAHAPGISPAGTVSPPSGGGAPGETGSATSRGDGERAGGDTAYLIAVDRHGNAVSWIQSLYHAFGSGLVEPETGVVLQDRGALFTLEEGHPNRIAPGKRPFHTLMPAMALRDGGLSLVLGTPGGDSQSQSLLQIFHRLFLFHMRPQEAVEAPRFRSYEGRRLAIEARVPVAARQDLRERGHRLEVVTGWTATFGGAQLVYVDPESGALVTAADPRREAYAIAY